VFTGVRALNARAAEMPARPQARFWRRKPGAAATARSGWIGADPRGL